MPQRQSAVKSLRKNKESRLRNKSFKSKIHTETIKFERAVEREDSAEANAQLQIVTKLLHQAAAKGIVHDNTAARKQARLQKQLNTINNE